MPVGIVMPLISSSLILSMCLTSVRMVLACETMRHLLPACIAGTMADWKKGMIRSAASLSDSPREASSWAGVNFLYLMKFQV